MSAALCLITWKVAIGPVELDPRPWRTRRRGRWPAPSTPTSSAHSGDGGVVGDAPPRPRCGRRRARPARPAVPSSVEAGQLAACVPRRARARRRAPRRGRCRCPSCGAGRDEHPVGGVAVEARPASGRSSSQRPPLRVGPGADAVDGVAVAQLVEGDRAPGGAGGERARAGRRGRGAGRRAWRAPPTRRTGPGTAPGPSPRARRHEVDEARARGRRAPRARAARSSRGRRAAPTRRR